MIALRPLPWSADALEGWLSARTVAAHHGQHEAGYVQALNRMTAAAPGLRNLPVERLMLGRTDARPIAAQVYNHRFYWEGLAPTATPSPPPPGPLQAEIERTFGSLGRLRGRFLFLANAVLGSGWCWLTWNGRALVVEVTKDADNPVQAGRVPLLACDVWEHAYYLDYESRRGDYLKGFWNAVAWDVVALRLRLARL
jgi:Fe-Mn family superoxide dismutase